MRVLLVSTMFPPDYDGGVEVNAAKFANGLRDAGHEVDVVTRKWRERYEGSKTQDPPWVHRILEAWRQPTLYKNWFLLRYESKANYVRATKAGSRNIPIMEGFLKDRAYDVVLAFESLGIGPLTVQPAVRKGIPVAWNVSNYALADVLAPSKLLYLTQRLFAGSDYRRERALPFDNLFFVSEFMKNAYASRGVHPRHPQVIRRGIEFPLPDSPTQPATPARYIVAGRISPAKGIHVVVEAAKILADKDPRPWRVEVYGGLVEGEEGYLDELKAQIAEHGLEDRFEFHGFVQRADLMGRMQGATGFIVSSVWDEPGCNTIIESLANGLPLIATRAGANEEIIRGEGSALLYERFSAQELAEHMAHLLADPAAAQAMAARGLALIRERYQFPTVLAELVSALESCIDRGVNG